MISTERQIFYLLHAYVSQVWNEITTHFFVSDVFIYHTLSQTFCLKQSVAPGDFENEIRQNGFSETLNEVQQQMASLWYGERWESVFHLEQTFRCYINLIKKRTFK